MRWCPKCHKSYPDLSTTCAHDGESLLDEATYRAMEDTHAPLQVAGTADNHFEADMLAALLAEEGIDVHIHDRDRQHATADFDPVDSYELLVHPSDVERARELIEKRKAVLAAESGEKAAQEEEETTEAK